MFVVFLFRVIVNCKSAPCEKTDDINLRAVISAMFAFSIPRPYHAVRRSTLQKVLSTRSRGPPWVSLWDGDRKWLHGSQYCLFSQTVLICSVRFSLINYSLYNHYCCTVKHNAACNLSVHSHNWNVSNIGRKGGLLFLSIITYGRYNHHFCTVSAVKVIETMKNLTMLCLCSEHNPELNKLMSHNSVFWPPFLNQHPHIGKLVLSGRRDIFDIRRILMLIGCRVITWIHTYRQTDRHTHRDSLL